MTAPQSDVGLAFNALLGSARFLPSSFFSPSVCPEAIKSDPLRILDCIKELSNLVGCDDINVVRLRRDGGEWQNTKSFDRIK